MFKRCSNRVQRTTIKYKELKIIIFVITLKYNVLQENTVPIVPVVFALIDLEYIDYTSNTKSTIQLEFICSKSTMETPDQCIEFVQL